ncbi:MAG: BlaI/MecI/CopY family transcriptional regulator [Planctomycetota bacterium]|nr:BlaI/MecI/CopY family transcriptional regulator [Planctomycetota bacterium]
MTRLHRLGDLQLAILRVLWKQGEATAAEVQADLAGDRDLALSTISTMLKRLGEQGIVSHRAEGRQFIYRAKVGEQQVRATMVRDLVSRLFRGDSAALVSHLVEAGEVEPSELEDLREQVRRVRSPRGGRHENE